MSLTAAQIKELKSIISRLENMNAWDDEIRGSLTAPNGVLSFIAPHTRNKIGYIHPLGGGVVMTWEGGIITKDTTRFIAHAVNKTFGPNFYEEVLLNGQGEDVLVSIKYDILPLFKEYQKKYDKTLPIVSLKAEREQVRALIKIAENPAGESISKNIPGTTLQRWRTLDRHLTAEIAKLESF